VLIKSGDYTTAFKEFAALAEQGDAAAQLFLPQDWDTQRRHVLSGTMGKESHKTTSRL
jgi:hypothetical protein